MRQRTTRFVIKQIGTQLKNFTRCNILAITMAIYGRRITDAHANGTIKYAWRILVTMFLSRVSIGNTKTISRRTVRIAPETKKGTYYFLQDFFWSDVCHTHISSQRIARTRMKRPAHCADQKNECVHTGTWYTWIHGTTHDTAVHTCAEYSSMSKATSPRN